MGVPININTESCSAVSSNCVVWQGPDIPCISLCYGDSITNVMYELAVQFCAALDQLKVSGYNIDCLPIVGCPPETFQELFQLVIDTLCGIQAQNGADGNNGNYTQVEPIPPTPETCVNGGVAITTYNGVTNEVINTYNICNGEDGTNGVQGIRGFRGDYIQTSAATLIDCPTGGIIVTVLSGEDDSIVSEETVCNGALGPVNDSYISNVQLTGTDLIFTGENLAFDGVVDLSSIGGTVTADNGLTKIGSNIQLGGTLILDTNIVATTTNRLTISGAGTNIAEGLFRVINSGDGGAMFARSENNSAIYAWSTNSAGGSFRSDGTFGIISQGTQGARINSREDINNTTNIALSLEYSFKTPGTLPQNGIGQKITIAAPRYDSLGDVVSTSMNELSSYWEEVLYATKKSVFKIKGVAITNVYTDVVSFKGDGETVLHQYGSGSFTGTLAYYLGVDSNGNIIEVTP